MASLIDSTSFLQTDPRKKKGLTGGSAKAAQGKDTSSLITGVHTDQPGFGSSTASMTDAQRAASTAPSYEQAYNVTGGSSGLAGYDTRMTTAEKETYRTGTMKIAATKVDDYSDWGKGVKAAAETATAAGKQTVQEKKDQLVIDARDASKYDWDVTRPAQAAASARLAAANRQSKAIAALSPRTPRTALGQRLQNRSGSRSMRGPTPRGGASGPTRGGLVPTGGPSSGMNPWEIGVTAAGQAALVKDGWTPQQAAEYGGNYSGGEARATQNALPGVMIKSSAEAAAMYGGTGRADATSQMALVGSKVGDPTTRNARYGQGLGKQKGKTLLSREAGGQ